VVDTGIAQHCQRHVVREIAAVANGEVDNVRPAAARRHPQLAQLLVEDKGALLWRGRQRRAEGERRQQPHGARRPRTQARRDDDSEHNRRPREPAVAGKDLANGEPRPRREGCRQQGGCAHTRQPTQNDLVTRSSTSQHAPRRARGDDRQRDQRPALPRNDRRTKGCKLGRTPARAAGGGPRRDRRQDESDAGRKRTETHQTETDRGPGRQTEEGGKEGAAVGRRPLPGHSNRGPYRDED